MNSPTAPSPAKPIWRARQRALPVAEKIDLLGRVIQETRAATPLYTACKLSVMPSQLSSPKAC